MLPERLMSTSERAHCQFVPASRSSSAPCSGSTGRAAIGGPAGLRTHLLVAAGAAAFTIASTYAFVGQGTVRDPARVAAQIVVGVGFLSAGTIWRTPNTLRGLTTAASV
jgi:uncharacterized membrane protein YhiD involved in acid resistance